ncbi:hypothetical protein GCM10017782_02120 [Deinococcus ficus]|nr:hypothetical protein GCM10017782_02120 [Deinococcus ficus]
MVAPRLVVRDLWLREYQSVESRESEIREGEYTEFTRCVDVSEVPVWGGGGGERRREWTLRC